MLLYPGTYVLERVDALSALLNLAPNDFRDELGGELGQVASRGFTGDDVGHLLPDLPNLRRPRVGRLLDLVGPSLGETDGEDADEVVVSGLDDHIGLDQGLPLAHERAELVGCDVETVKVGEAVLALHLIDAQLDLAESVVLVLLQIGERNLKDAALESIVGVLETGGAVHERLADTAGITVLATIAPLCSIPHSLLLVSPACGVCVWWCRTL